MAPVSDEQPGGWARPEQPVPPGWSAQQPPPFGPAYGAPQGGPPPGWGPPPGAAPGWAGPQPGWGPAYAPPPPPPPKPGIIALRPMGVGEILDGAISAMRGYPRIMLGLSAVVAAVCQVLTVPVTWLLLRDAGENAFSLDRPASNDQQLTFAASALSATGVQVLVTLVATLVLTGVLTVVVSRAVLGRSITAREAWDQARPRVPALIGVTLLVPAIVLGLAVVTLGPGLLLAVAGAPVAAVAVAFVAGVPVLLVGAVYAYTAFALAPPAIVLERQGVVAALRRSRALVKGAWWRTFGILLLVNIIAGVLANILSIPFQLVAYGVAWVTGHGLDIYALEPLLVTAVGSVVASAVTWPFTAVATALLYVDRRMRREALDLELARAAGLAPGAPLPRA